MIARYMRWLHTGWPAGTVEKLPDVREGGLTNVPGVRVVGDLTGIPLLKFSADTGARAVQAILAEPDFAGARGQAEVHDLVIIGAGVSGCAAAVEARKAGLDCVLYEADRTFSTVKNFPKGKPIYTYPTEMVPAGDIRFHHEVKEPLVADLDRQVAAAGVETTAGRVERLARKGKIIEVHLAGGAVAKALRVIVAIGRSGNFRKLGVPGEESEKVFNRLHDPKEFVGQRVLVVGGGDSALEAAIALTTCGAHVTLSYRKPELNRAKPENTSQIMALVADPMADVAVEEPSSERQTTAITHEMMTVHPAGSLRLALGSQVQRIDAADIALRHGDGRDEVLANDAVFLMIGREAPLDFFRRSGIRVRGEWSPAAWAGLAAFFAFCVFIYHWKSYYWFPTESLNPAKWMGWLGEKLGESAQRTDGLLYTVLRAASGPAFWYTLLYSTAIGVFGYRRMKRRPTPYVRRQTLTLLAFQVVPLFLLPEIILPWMGRNGFFADGAFLKGFADLFFEPYGDGGPLIAERAYWRAYGFILAWPLMVYNWFTQAPIVGWLVLGSIQTFVIIPLIVRRWGKGAYCGWVCSCGALAETLGDTHRHKMPHGPKWNRLNMLGQAVLALAIVMMGLRIWGWLSPEGYVATHFDTWLQGKSALSYKWAVDIALAGFLGVSFYFHFSGRIWCRFACPLAALMHIYARFSKFRIFADKKKCISCNVCTSVCHQGIDIMSFANKGIPMADPECVRCSACVQSCPTGVLTFGHFKGQEIVYDRTPASLVQLTEALNKAKAA
ncbi:MAG: NAD(P)-binding domain-containing protein [bacterium]